MIARDDCPSCHGEGVTTVKCCGSRLLYDCCCGCTGGWTYEPCEPCEDAHAAKEEAAADKAAA